MWYILFLLIWSECMIFVVYIAKELYMYTWTQRPCKMNLRYIIEDSLIPSTYQKLYIELKVDSGPAQIFCMTWFIPRHPFTTLEDVFGCLGLSGRLFIQHKPPGAPRFNDSQGVFEPDTAGPFLPKTTALDCDGMGSTEKQTFRVWIANPNAPRKMGRFFSPRGSKFHRLKKPATSVQDDVFFLNRLERPKGPDMFLKDALFHQYSIYKYVYMHAAY